MGVFHCIFETDSLIYDVNCIFEYENPDWILISFADTYIKGIYASEVSLVLI